MGYEPSGGSVDIRTLFGITGGFSVITIVEAKHPGNLVTKVRLMASEQVRCCKKLRKFVDVESKCTGKMLL